MNRRKEYEVAEKEGFITYVCTHCKAEDHDRLSNQNHPIVLNCWNCGAGRGKELKEMIALQIGMFPKK